MIFSVSEWIAIIGIALATIFSIIQLLNKVRSINITQKSGCFSKGNQQTKIEKDKNINIHQKSGMGSKGGQSITYIENQYVNKKNNSDESISLSQIASSQSNINSNVIESLIGGRFSIAKMSQVKNIQDLYPYLLLFDKAFLINFMNLFNDPLYGWYDTGDAVMGTLDFVKELVSEEKPKDLSVILSEHISAGLVDNFIIANEMPSVVPYTREKSKILEDEILESLNKDSDNKDENELIASAQSKKLYMDILVNKISNHHRCILMDLEYQSSFCSASEKQNEKVDKLRIIALGIFSRILNKFPKFSNVNIDDFVKIREKSKDARESINRTLHRIAIDIYNNLDSLTCENLVLEIDSTIAHKIIPDLDEYNDHISYYLRKYRTGEINSTIAIDGLSTKIGEFDYSVFLKTLHHIQTM